tara:strand:+ start:177 stop:548 length:372 start_codon:yes stop_codon:yes gene_type:complete
MKKFLLLCSALFICCEDNASLNIEYLKDNGYKEITCKTVESYQTNDSSFIEINKKFKKDNDFIVARCFDKDSCLLNLNVRSSKIVCQRYIITKENQDKRDYIHSDYREFVDHRVLYLTVNYID